MKCFTSIVSFKKQQCRHVSWATPRNKSGNGSVKMRVMPRGREGTECLVALLVPFDEVAMQFVQEDTVRAASDKADSC